MLSNVCISGPSFELHKPEYPHCGATDCGDVIVYKLWCVVV